MPKESSKRASIDAAAAVGNDGDDRGTKGATAAGAAPVGVTMTRDDRITRTLSSMASISTVTGATSTARDVSSDHRRLLSAQDSGTLNSKDLRALARSGGAGTTGGGGGGGNSDDSIGLPLSLSIVKGLRRKSSSIGVGSSSTGGASGGSGNNSDNSGLVSLGNNSFGFNFDSEEGTMGGGSASPPDADKSSSSDSDNGTEKRRGQRRNNNGSSSNKKNNATAGEVTASSSNGGGGGSVLTEGAVAAVKVSRTPGAIPAQVGSNKSHHGKKRRMDSSDNGRGGSSSSGNIKRTKQGANVHASQQPLPPESKPSSSSLDSHRSGGGSEDGSGSGNDSGTSGSSGSGGSSSGSGSNGNGSRTSSGKSTVSSLTMSSTNPNDSNVGRVGGGSPSSNGGGGDGGRDADQAESTSYDNLAAASTAEEAAAQAVAHLQSIANAVDKKAAKDSKKKMMMMKKKASEPSSSAPSEKQSGQKRKVANDDDDDDDGDVDDGDSGGYNSDDEGGVAATQSRAPPMGQPSAGAAQPEVRGALPASGPAVGPSAVAATATNTGTTTKKKAPSAKMASVIPAAAQPIRIPSAATAATQSTQVSSSVTDISSPPPKKKTRMTAADRREERNQREKERSFRISKQIDELRVLLSSGGVIVPKGTKSAVLSEAANYIRMLQQHQYKSEIDRAQLIQQMQIIGGGTLGPQAATAVRHVAAQNGVWSLGNFGGVPPRSAMQLHQQMPAAAAPAAAAAAEPEAGQPQQASGEPQLVTSVDEHDYRFVFNSCSVGMAIASMGGAFIDCNQLFCQLSQYSKQEVCSMTIFNLTSRQDLQHAFDLISKMISPPPDGGSPGGNPPPCVLRGAMKHREDLGLSIALIKGEDGIAKCFAITLIKNPASPFDTSRPIPATADFLRVGGPQSDQGQVTASSSQDMMEQKRPSTKPNTGNMSAPAYTTG